MKMNLIFQIVEKDNFLWLEKRTMSKMKLGYDSMDDLIKWVKNLENLEFLKRKVMNTFEMNWFVIDENEYLEIYIEEDESNIWLKIDIEK